MNLTIAILIFIVGISIGSFLNAVIWRLHTKENFLKGRSYCPKCRAHIRARDLMPVMSFLLLRGKCRDCGKSISWQYPLIELVTAVAFVILYGVFGLTISFFVAAVYTGFLVIVFMFDLKHYLILDRVMLPAAIVAFFGSLLIGLSIWNILLGAVIGGGFFMLQFLLSGGKWIGGGDIRLGAVMGLMLGWQGVLVALFISYLVGSITGVILIFSGRKSWQSRLPFGVFLTLATFIALVWGDAIASWYSSILGYQ
ncbi:MAG: prepilin peptidase [bacterium]|nr:prepilin peptidase [bacterium]